MDYKNQKFGSVDESTLPTTEGDNPQSENQTKDDIKPVVIEDMPHDPSWHKGQIWF